MDARRTSWSRMLQSRRGFIFPSSEIYGGINGFWDYGPLGVEPGRNIKDAWWKDTVTRHSAAGRSFDVVGLDCSIIMHPRVWEASGHVGGFSDPMSTCRQCKRLFRTDQVWDQVRESEWFQSLSKAIEKGSEPRHVRDWAQQKGKKPAPGLRGGPEHRRSPRPILPRTLLRWISMP